ncbi:two-component sensor histidine kinase [Paenibacillus baekrokdamisoli]|uniref:histidine kinase n=1 Tax=Paenibacillus baekrokdamisoli TaxID=1712516 RepID=A0A3G9J969_9BACL|nr:HAMP domain-containing sensor histidine kinase [Paenibacillus baekrokdamisoli]MBB3072566.1 signal transduction histidine kinase [Paenibacillus baekrokdamisoli]BBH22381.1 two-component sensor histidine kinase [Paenibacillus baekrokdamisoli]
MNVKKRFIFQYIRQLLFVGLLLLVLILGTFTLTIVKLERLDQESDFIKSGLPVLADSITEHDGKIQFDPKLLAQVRKQGGWLQVIGKDGEATAAYNTPADVPGRYNPGELMSYWKAEKDFPYGLYAWIQELDGQSYTLLYGVKNDIPKLKRNLLQQVTWRAGKIEVNGTFKQELNDTHGWIEVLDGNGKVLGGYGKTNEEDEAPDHYSVQDLMLRSQYPERYGMQLFTVYDTESGNTWIIHAPLSSSAASSANGDTYKGIINVFIWNAAALLVMVLLLFLLLALWYGHRFGTPILHMIDWLHHLAKGELHEPTGRNPKGLPFSRKRSGRLKGRFRAHSEMIESLAHLTGTLQKNEHIRKQLETTREDWIAGVSHDMKTPLSSILGYAHLMESRTYEWSQAEIREFAAIMREKSSYMDEMINDLTLTYRLKNEAFAFEFIPTNMNEFIEQTIQKWKHHPQFANVPIHFTASEPSIIYPIDAKYFRRVLENLLANAALHNPEGTWINVSMVKDNGSHFVIRIQDNGVGIDEETKQLLFERYYRGTNTDELMQGTGLGMAISKQLVIQHQGQIEVQSQPGTGTTISLIFRAAEL